MKKFDLSAVTDAWCNLVASAGDVGTIKSQRQLKHNIELLDGLLDATEGDTNHPLQGLLWLVADHIEAYESKTLPEPISTAAGRLQLLMESNGLKQSDLAAIMGGQSVVSAVLNGHRSINAKQAAALAKRFCMSPAVFIDMPEDAAAPASGRKPAVVKASKPAARRMTPTPPTTHPGSSPPRARSARAKLAAAV